MNTSRVSNPQMSIQKKQKSASLAHHASQFSRQWINIAHQKSRARQIAEKLTTAGAFTIQAKNTAWYRTLLGCKHYNERTNKGCSAWRWDLLCIRVDCRRGKIVRSEKPTISRYRYGRRAKTREVHPTRPRSIWSAGLAVFTWKVWHFAIGAAWTITMDCYVCLEHRMWSGFPIVAGLKTQQNGMSNLRAV